MKSRRLKLERLDGELRQIEAALDEGRDRKGAVDRDLTTVRASVHGETPSLILLLYYTKCMCIA